MIEIAAYQPGWPVLFQEMARGLRAALGATALRIDHIGATAVPGLAARPILDIQVAAACLEPVDAVVIPLRARGYIFRPADPDLTRQFLHAGPGMPRCHIHVRSAGSDAEQGALLFRDYMRGHEAETARYTDLKWRLAAECRDLEEYTRRKSAALQEIMARAADWSRAAGWRPGPADG